MEENINESNEKLNKINILVSGKTGVGKSTLINAIFNEELTKTGIGKPVTNYIEQISDDNNYISLFDTVGINIKNYKKVFENLENFIKEKNSDSNENNHIHLAWICISDGSSRIEDMEINLEMLLSKYIPTIIVITKSFYKSELLEEMKTICPNAKLIIPINSKEVELKKDISVKQKNLDKLMECSEKIILNNDISELSINDINNINIEKSNNSLIKENEIFDTKNQPKEIYNAKFINNNFLKNNIKNNLLEDCEKIIINFSKVMAVILEANNENKNNKLTNLKIKLEIEVIKSITKKFNANFSKEEFKEIKENLYKNYEEINKEIKKKLYKNYKKIEKKLNLFFNEEIEKKIKEKIVNKYKVFDEKLYSLLKTKNHIKKIIPENLEKEIIAKFYICNKIYFYILENILNENKNNKNITIENINITLSNINDFINKKCPKTTNETSKKEIVNKIDINKKSPKTTNETSKKEIVSKIESCLDFIDSYIIAKMTIRFIDYKKEIYEEIKKKVDKNINKILSNVTKENKQYFSKEFENIKKEKKDIFIIENNGIFLEDVPLIKLEGYSDKIKKNSYIDEIKKIKEDGYKYIDECINKCNNKIK